MLFFFYYLTVSADRGRHCNTSSIDMSWSALTAQRSDAPFWLAFVPSFFSCLRRAFPSSSAPSGSWTFILPELMASCKSNHSDDKVLVLSMMSFGLSSMTRSYRLPAPLKSALPALNVAWSLAFPPRANRKLPPSRPVFLTFNKKCKYNYVGTINLFRIFHVFRWWLSTG